MQSRVLYSTAQIGGKRAHVYLVKGAEGYEKTCIEHIEAMAASIVADPGINSVHASHHCLQQSQLRCRYPGKQIFVRLTILFVCPRISFGCRRLAKVAHPVTQFILSYAVKDSIEYINECRRIKPTCECSLLDKSQWLLAGHRIRQCSASLLWPCHALPTASQRFWDRHLHSWCSQCN